MLGPSNPDAAGLAQQATPSALLLVVRSLAVRVGRFREKIGAHLGHQLTVYYELFVSSGGLISFDPA
jgi:hypothetical protein